MTKPVVIPIDGDPRGLLAALNRIDANIAKTERRAQNFGRVVGGAFAVGGVVRGLEAVTKTAGDFDTTVREAGAAAHVNAKQLQVLGDAARTAGLKQKVGAQQAAEAQRELARAGLSVSQIVGGGMTAALNLAAASGENVADTSRIVANALNAFGLSGSQATKVADQLTIAANATTSSVGDTGLALAQSAAAAKVAGLTLTDTNVALTALARIGVRGSDAGTSLKTTLVHLAKPTEKAAETMKRLGLEFFDAHGNMKSITDVSAMLETRLGGLTNQQRQQALAQIAGNDGFRALIALYELGRTGSEKYSRALQEQGVAAKQAAERNAGTGGAIREASAAWTEAKLQIGDVAAPVITKELGKFSDAVEKAGSNGALKVALSDVGTILGDVAHVGEQAAKVGGGIAHAWAAVPKPIRDSAIAFGLLAAASRKIAGVGLPSFGLGGGAGRAESFGGAAVSRAANVQAAEQAATRAARRVIAQHERQMGVRPGGLTGLARIVAEREAGIGQFTPSAQTRTSSFSQWWNASRASRAIGRDTRSLTSQRADFILGGRGSSAESRAVGQQIQAMQRLQREATQVRNAARSAALGGFSAKGVGGAAAAGAVGAAMGGSFLEKVVGGAAVGSIGGPWGMAGGAVAAAAGAGIQEAFKALKKNEARQLGEEIAKGVGAGLKKDTRDQLANDRKDIRDAGNKRHKVVDGIGFAAPDPHSAEERRYQAALASGGRNVGRGIVRDLSKGREFVNPTLLTKQFLQRMKGQEPEFRAAGASEVAAYLRGLESKDPELKGAARRFLKKVGGEIEKTPQSAKVRLRLKVESTASDARKSLAKILDSQANMFPEVSKAADQSFEGIVTSANRRLGELAKIMHGSTGATKREQKAASKEFAKLKDSIADYVKAGGDSLVSLRGKVDEVGGSVDKVRNKLRVPLNFFSSNDDSPKPKARRRGGMTFRAGGMVDVIASPGEVFVGPDGTGGVVPGAPVAADTVPMTVPSGTAFITSHGQELMASGASLGEAIAAQRPHFASGGIAGANHRYPAHKMGAKGAAQLSASVVRAIANASGLPGLGFQQIARGESNYFPGVISSDGGHGLWQMTPRVWGSAAKSKMASLGGLGAMLNPLKNGQMAKFLYDDDRKRGGNGYRPWFGTKYLTAAGIASSNMGGVKLKASKAGRSGLVSDAFAQGFALGSEGYSSSDLAAYGNPVLKSVSDAIGSAPGISVPKAAGGSSKLPKGNVKGVDAKLGAFAGGLVKKFGLTVTSTTGGNHAKNSYHYKGMAVDLAGSRMGDAARWIAASPSRYSKLLEGIHNPSLSVKNGAKVGAGIWGQKVWKNHGNHIHLAMRKGGFAGLPGVNVKAGLASGGSDFYKALGQAAEDASFARVERTVEALTALASGGGDGKVIARARAAISVLDHALGLRVGRAVSAATASVSEFQGRMAATDDMQRIQGIDPSSAFGVADRMRPVRDFLAGANNTEANLQRAVARADRQAKRTGSDSDYQALQAAKKALEDFQVEVRGAKVSMSELQAAQRVSYQSADDLDAALARLTATTDDDNAVQQRRLANTEAALQQALAAGDTEQATQLANTLADLRDSARATSDNTQQLAELMQQIKDGQEAIQRNMAAMDVQALLGQALSTWQGAMVAQTVGFGTPNGSRY